MAARPWEFESPRAHKMSENYFQGNKNHPQHVSEKIGQLKMRASDGKFYLTDVADTEGIFRIIQSNKVLNLAVSQLFFFLIFCTIIQLHIK